jgi:hypothetical protein
MAADGRYVCVMDPLPSSHQNVGNINTQTRSVEAYIAMPGSTIGVNNIVIVNRVW